MQGVKRSPRTSALQGAVKVETETPNHFPGSPSTNAAIKKPARDAGRKHMTPAAKCKKPRRSIGRMAPSVSSSSDPNTQAELSGASQPSEADTTEATLTLDPKSTRTLASAGGAAEGDAAAPQNHAATPNAIKQAVSDTDSSSGSDSDSDSSDSDDSGSDSSSDEDEDASQIARDAIDTMYSSGQLGEDIDCRLVDAPIQQWREGVATMLNRRVRSNHHLLAAVESLGFHTDLPVVTIRRTLASRKRAAKQVHRPPPISIDQILNHFSPAKLHSPIELTSGMLQQDAREAMDALQPPASNHDGGSGTSMSPAQASGPDTQSQGPEQMDAEMGSEGEAPGASRATTTAIASAAAATTSAATAAGDNSSCPGGHDADDTVASPVADARPAAANGSAATRSSAGLQGCLPGKEASALSAGACGEGSLTEESGRHGAVQAEDGTAARNSERGTSSGPEKEDAQGHVHESGAEGTTRDGDSSPVGGSVMHGDEKGSVRAARSHSRERDSRHEREREMREACGRHATAGWRDSSKSERRGRHEDRSRDRDRDGEMDRSRGRSRERDRGRHNSRSRSRERDRGRHNSRGRSRERDRGRDSGRDRENSSKGRSRDRRRDRERGRDTSRDEERRRDDKVRRPGHRHRDNDDDASGPSDRNQRGERSSKDGGGGREGSRGHRRSMRDDGPHRQTPDAPLQPRGDGHVRRRRESRAGESRQRRATGRDTLDGRGSGGGHDRRMTRDERRESVSAANLRTGSRDSNAEGARRRDRRSSPVQLPKPASSRHSGRRNSAVVPAAATGARVHSPNTASASSDRSATAKRPSSHRSPGKRAAADASRQEQNEQQAGDGGFLHDDARATKRAKVEGMSSQALLDRGRELKHKGQAVQHNSLQRNCYGCLASIYFVRAMRVDPASRSNAQARRKLQSTTRAFLQHTLRECTRSSHDSLRAVLFCLLAMLDTWNFEDHIPFVKQTTNSLLSLFKSRAVRSQPSPATATAASSDRKATGAQAQAQLQQNQLRHQQQQLPPGRSPGTFAGSGNSSSSSSSGGGGGGGGLTATGGGGGTGNGSTLTNGQSSASPTSSTGSVSANGVSPYMDRASPALGSGRADVTLPADQALRLQRMLTFEAHRLTALDDWRTTRVMASDASMGLNEHVRKAITEAGELPHAIRNWSSVLAALEMAVEATLQDGSTPPSTTLSASASSSSSSSCAHPQEQTRKVGAEVEQACRSGHSPEKRAK